MNQELENLVADFFVGKKYFVRQVEIKPALPLEGDIIDRDLTFIIRIKKLK